MRGARHLIRRLALLTVALVPLAFAGSAHAVTTSRYEEPRPLPPFVFNEPSGVQHALADYRGRYVLLNIWATWCGPCVKEMPSLDALQARFDPQRFVILPVAQDRADYAVQTFYRNRTLTHLPQLIDPAGIATSAFKLRGIPSSLLIDPQGREVARLEGSVDWVSPSALTFIETIVGPTTPSEITQ